MKPPEVLYARSGDVAIAYQVVGDGPPWACWRPLRSVIRSGRSFALVTA